MKLLLSFFFAAFAGAIAMACAITEPDASSPSAAPREASFTDTRPQAILTNASLPQVSLAETGCASSPTPSCQVYRQCFARYCPCENSPDEYFISYGHRYCQAFLDRQGFSEVGRRWRDSTLICLQEAIVPELDISANPSCNCARMKQIAYASHVRCYTRSNPSICSLPVADLMEIRRTIEIPDMLSGDGRRQMAEVAGICKNEAPDDIRRTTWRAIAALIS